MFGVIVYGSLILRTGADGVAMALVHKHVTGRNRYRAVLVTDELLALFSLGYRIIGYTATQHDQPQHK